MNFQNPVGLFLSRLPALLMQGVQAHKSLLTEVTTPGEERTNAFGKISLCVGIGFIIAPIINGFSAIYSESAFLYIGMGLPMLALWITEVFIPKKEVCQQNSKVSWKIAVQLVKREKVLTILLEKNISVLFGSSGFVVLQLFLISDFSLTLKQNSLIQVFIGISMIVVSGILLPVLRKRILEQQLIIFSILNVVSILFFNELF